MTKTFLTTLFCFIGTGLFAQQKIETALTAEHKAVAGTKISLIPPADFTKGHNFLGFQHTESGSSLMILDIPGPFGEVSKGLTKENLLSKGVVVQTIDPLTINHLPALFVTGTQVAHGNTFTKYILVLGTEKETIIVNGVFPEHLTTAATSIKQAMLSVYYEPEKQTDPFAALDFTIDAAGTKLKFAKNVSNSLLFTVDGNVPTQSDDKTNLIVAKSFSEVTPGDKKQFSLNRIKQFPTTVEHLDFVREITIDGLSGYETYAIGKNKNTGQPEHIYQVILFDDKVYYILVSMTNDTTKGSLDDARKAVNTFKRK